MKEDIQNSLMKMNSLIEEYPLQKRNLGRLSSSIEEDSLPRGIFNAPFLKDYSFQGARVGGHKGIALVFCNYEDEEDAIQLEFFYPEAREYPIVYITTNDVDVPEREIDFSIWEHPSSIPDSYNNNLKHTEPEGIRSYFETDSSKISSPKNVKIEMVGENKVIVKELDDESFKRTNDRVKYPLKNSSKRDNKW